MQIEPWNIKIRVVEQHETYKGASAMLAEGGNLLPVTIVRTSTHAATVKHVDGQLQKVMWGHLYDSQG
jgi:hypothetical protein